jgi:hypothetical protein
VETIDIRFFSLEGLGTRDEKGELSEQIRHQLVVKGEQVVHLGLLAVDLVLTLLYQVVLSRNLGAQVVV